MDTERRDREKEKRAHTLYTHIYTRIHTYIYTYAHIHTHTETYTNTHTNTHLVLVHQAYELCRAAY